jgi:hypothetical protein
MAIHDEEAFPEGISPEEALIMEEALVVAGIGAGTPPDPGLAPSTHPDLPEGEPPEAPPPGGHPEVPSGTM